MPSGWVKFLNLPGNALSSTTLSLRAICPPSDWRRAGLICKYCAAIPSSPAWAACKKPSMVPVGVARPRGSTGLFAAAVAVGVDGRTWLSAVPAEVRQVPKPNTHTNRAVGKEDMIFSHAVLRGRAPALRNNRSIEAIIVSKRRRGRTADVAAALSALGPVNVSAGADENLGGFHHRLRECRMRMDRHRYIAGQRRHLDGEHPFGNHLAGASADDPHSQHPFALRIDKEFGHAFRAIESDGPPGRRPGELGDLDLSIFFLRLRFGQAAPGNLGIGKDNRRNRVRFEGHLMSSNGLDRDPAFMRRLVRQHGLADHIPNGVDGRIFGLQLLVHLNEAALANLHSRFF